MPKPVFQATAEGLPTRRQFLGALTAVPLVAAPFGAAIFASGSAVAAHTDAKLLALGYDLVTAWCVETAASDALESQYSSAADEHFEQANKLCTRIVREIEACHASTLEGLAVKALAISWCHCGAPITDESLNDHATTDARLAASMVRDLLPYAPSRQGQRETV